jgi:antagonist of KipI
MDWFALRAANALVGNPAGAAGLEFALDAPILQAGEDCLVATAGRGYVLHVQGRRVGLWRAALVRQGEVIEFSSEGTAGWGYLAILGGIAVPLVMGSRSTCLRGGFGGWNGRFIWEGDILPIGGGQPIGWRDFAGRWLPPAKRLTYQDEVEVAVVPGPQAELFTIPAREMFLNETYSISANSDRMGYRLNGPRIDHQGSADLISEAMTWGAVQVPADGMPIVMMSDRPTTGGYPKIATLTRTGLPLLAQAMPGNGRVRFQPASVVEAQVRYREMLAWIETEIQGDEDGYGYGVSY